MKLFIYTYSRIRFNLDKNLPAKFVSSCRKFKTGFKIILFCNIIMAKLKLFLTFMFIFMGCEVG